MTQTVLDLLERAARERPDACACADDKRELSYGGLLEAVRAVAASIVSRGIRRSPIIVFIDRSVDALVAMLGIAYSGNHYVVMDVTTPASRAQAIFGALDAPLAFVGGETADAFAALGFPGETVAVDEAESSVPGAEVDAARQAVIGRDLLYVLFTSGSTGVPKGVMIRHESIVNYAEAMLGIYGLGPEMRIANQAPFYFDKSHFDIYVTLAAGGALFIPQKKLFSYPVRALEYLREHEVNTLFWIPTVLTGIARMRALGRVHVDSLDKIILGAEAMPMRFFNMWRAAYPDALFANMYGPTETTIDCAYYVVDREFGEDEKLPIGGAVPGNELIVLDDEGRLIENTRVGELGELYVRGIGVAVGYLGDEARTAEAFVKNPLDARLPDVLYRTGDLVSYDERGLLIYHGRGDSQIKRHGYRIELGEVEAAAQGVDGVDVCCSAYDADRQKIALYYAGRAEEDQVAETLAARLPHYMVPDILERVRALPTNQNGKIDRKLIASWAREGRPRG